MWRSVRWLDRCITQHKKNSNDNQNIFAIIQGGLDTRLRDICLDEMIKRKDSVNGYAIGGLSGGEAKDIFWKIIAQCASKLPEDRPRYSMGIGFAEDLLVCIALGVDMADCVFPTRTARFGVALTLRGPLNLRLNKHVQDLDPIDHDCPCPTCQSGTSRAFLHHNIGIETAAAHAITQHNIVFQAKLMGGVRDAILNDTFPSFLQDFFREYYSGSSYPRWIVDALNTVGVNLLEGITDVRLTDRNGANWDYAN